jgi:hypothetical protein
MIGVVEFPLHCCFADRPGGSYSEFREAICPSNVNEQSGQSLRDLADGFWTMVGLDNNANVGLQILRSIEILLP